MTAGHFAAYQFMVSKFGGVSFDSLEAFKEGVISEQATKRFLPSKTWGMLNIDTNEILAEGYLCRYGFDLIKVKNGVVAEYYRRLISNKKHIFVAYDLETLQIIESYENVRNQLQKLDWKTGQQLQANNNCTYDSLPQELKTAIRDFAYGAYVFMYAIKPYGRVVEFYYPKY